MPGCHPASSEFLRSGAYVVETSGVIRVCQYGETLSHVQFLISCGTGYTYKNAFITILFYPW